MTDLSFLESCRGQGTSLVTLILSAGSQPSDITRRITAEMSAASNIKSRVNRLSVQSALRSIMAYAKTQRKLSDTGVAIFSGQYV